MNKSVPKLRFKEFSDKWKEYKLKEVADIVGGGTPSTTKNEYWNGQVQWFTPSEIGKSKYVENSIRTITELGVKKSSAKILPIGTILLTTRATLGEMAILKKEGTTNQGFQSLIVKKNYNTEFIYYLKNQISRYCYKNASGSTFLEISKFNLEKCKIKVPSLEEQEKISYFFTIIDRLIEEQEGKVRDLELYKKGMMQKIFKQEIRFKDENGLDYPGWEKKELSEFTERVVRKNKDEESKTPLTISAQYGLVDQQEFFNKNIASQSLEGYYLIENGEFAYNKSYSNGYPFGTIKRLDRYNKGALSTLYICFRPKNNVISDFLVQYFESRKWHKEISMIAVEGARNHGLLNVAVSEFFETMHIIPCLEEQTKIANFLSNIDKIIEEEKKNLDDLREMKKGLLQQMFV